MPDLDLPALKKLYEAATPGPWEAQLVGHDLRPDNNWMVVNHPMGQVCRVMSTRGDNGKFIAAARTAVPQLISQFELLDEAHTRVCDEVQILRAEKEQMDANYIAAVNGRKEFRQSFSDSQKENTALKAEVEMLRMRGYTIADTHYIRTLKEENQALKAEVESYKASLSLLNKTATEENQALRDLLVGLKEIANQPMRDRWCIVQPQLLTLLELISLRINAALGEK